MKFLVDLNLSPRLADQLRRAGHDATHAASRSLHAAPDEAVLGVARAEGRVLVSADSDFGTILAASRATRPSVLYLRGTTGRRVEQLAERIIAALPNIEEDLTSGSLVVIEPTLIRIRPLPIL